MSIEVKGELDFGDVPAFTPETTPAERREIWLKITDMSEEDFDAMFAENKARQVNVPELGSEAPDFELDILDKVAGRLDKKIKLSSLQGKPVGLIFGSYT
jgi:hypothetical protein